MVEVAAEIQRGLGAPLDQPAAVLTDSLSNGQVARRKGAAQRLKHSLRRWAGIKKRSDAGLVAVHHVGDASMPADFLTKWVAMSKIVSSLEYLTNRFNKIFHPRDPANPAVKRG